ncbi:MAG: 50S ribosomal protein L18 [Phycisphaerae bacterium]|nr:50S ribosomal protein L18 [Phycisphaerae bacterium]
MKRLKIKAIRRTRRKHRVRKSVFGTPERPRLTVMRSLQHISVQVIDDLSGRTLVQASTHNKDLRATIGYGGNQAAAAKLGAELAQRAKAKGIERVAFDRNGYRYHGRVKAFADAAREGGLSF